MTADVDEQGGVVDDRPPLLVEPDPLGQPQRDQALAQHVLHRLPEAEVDAERQRRDELRQADVRAISLAGHRPTLHPLATAASYLSAGDAQGIPISSKI